jgi:alpha-tubulin suppressor-like RCC1 family protein
VKLGCGAEFSMILDCKGALHSFGLPEYGQLGKSSYCDSTLYLMPFQHGAMDHNGFSSEKTLQNFTGNTCS